MFYKHKTIDVCIYIYNKPNTSSAVKRGQLQDSNRTSVGFSSSEPSGGRHGEQAGKNEEVQNAQIIGAMSDRNDQI